MKCLKSLSLFIPSLFLAISLSACTPSKNIKAENTSEVQQGIVMAVKRIIVKPEPIQPRGGFGVSVGSGGHSGVYGTVDLATLGGLFGKPKKDKIMQEIIVKRDNGSLVAITQPEKGPFLRGDKVRIVERGNQARVIRK